ncbi:MAG: hypothetical protein ACYDC9_09680 [Dermatophilaceae bacterium]
MLVTGEPQCANRGTGHPEGDRRVQAPQPTPLGSDGQHCGASRRGKEDASQHLVWRSGQVSVAGKSRSARRGQVEDEHPAADDGHRLGSRLKPATQGQLCEEAEAPP